MSGAGPVRRPLGARAIASMQLFQFSGDNYRPIAACCIGGHPGSAGERAPTLPSVPASTNNPIRAPRWRGSAARSWCRACRGRQRSRSVLSANRNGQDGARRASRSCQSQKNLHDGKGQLAVKVVFSNPEQGSTISHRGKDLRWCRSAGVDNYNWLLPHLDVIHGRKSPMPRDIVAWHINLAGELAQHAQQGTGEKRYLPRSRAATIDDLHFIRAGRYAQQSPYLATRGSEIRITRRGDRKVDMTELGIAVGACGSGIPLKPGTQQTRNLQATEIFQ